MRSVATLFGNLYEYEGKLKFKRKLEEIDNKKKKGIALNAIKEMEPKEEEDPKNDKLEMIMRKSKKIYKGDLSSNKEGKDRSYTSNVINLNTSIVNVLYI